LGEGISDQSESESVEIPLFGGCHDDDDYRTISWSSEVPAVNFATGDIVLRAHANVTPVVSIEPVVNVVESRLHRW
jgi:hypothetical protein